MILRDGGFVGLGGIEDHTRMEVKWVIFLTLVLPLQFQIGTVVCDGSICQIKIFLPVCSSHCL